MVTGNSDSGLDATDESFIGVIQEAPLYATFEKKNYETNEQIIVQLKLMKSLVGVDITHESSGFSVAGDVTSNIDEDSGCRIYNVALMYDGVTETPHFKFGVVTDEGLTVYAEVFGYLSDYGLFISDSSHDAAKESSYYYLVEAGVLT